ncbi:LOW QUALITY PROTEIN: cell division cycle-associated protein 7 [Cajanus cajan]|uniref:LOW QUALITY PROTEIN: cell division cycle-associated protein 7 n=1 Tax=Cajanus cajan TaxID=3821 RepID=UPI00098D7CED|nr:LOW QUALITY PROTEIN: cell division cycle-associated protein 7 [Cajanus cajan]
MPALPKRTRTAEPAAVGTNETPHEHKMSEYELSREQRIRENRERMGKLGIFDLSLTLKLNTKKSSRSYSSHNHKPFSPPLRPHRRSSRLQNVTPVSYSEAPIKKAEFVENGRVVIEEGSKPEAYTEEHDKLLGNTDKPWTTLFVDGVGKDGKRIYDSVRGKTCHQCRQKTLGYRTHCSQCNLVQGQFCGDCLYMRYGEHVLEALQNPTWLCPVCRGICNCSLCRQAKGWAPTGPLYKKISALGYKSVAHYLIQTRRSVNGEKNADASNPVSAKRSLPFSDVDDKKSPEANENLGLLKPLAETEGDGAEVSAKRSLLFSDEKDQPEKVECSDTPKPLQLKKNKCSDTKKLLASSSKPSSDSIAGRLRSRLKKP